jgi:HAD superfamily hydrolase (TIGR01450 family)
LAVPLATGSATALVARYDAGLLDLDGVVYIGPNPVAHAAESLAEARSRGMRLAFVTNNAARTPQEVADQLTRLGVTAAAAEVATSAQAAARLVAGLVTPGSAVLVVGGEALEDALRERGLRPVRSADDGPSAVVQGYHPDVNWRQLAEGTFAVHAGLPWVASNTDLTIPTPRGIAPGNGTLVSVIRLATGVEPLVAGKPELALHRESIDRVESQRPLIIGDRLDTDIEGAVRAGTDSLLVLTGVTGAAELLAAPPTRRPTYVAADLRGLLRSHDDVVLAGGEAVLGSWAARVQAGRLRLSGAGDPVDGLRAACVAAWSFPGEVDTDEVVLRLAATPLTSGG